MVVWGGLFTAPIMHTWFHLIERAIPGTGKLVVAKKVVVDMVIMAPAMALGFFTVTKSLEGTSVNDAFEVAKAKLQPTLSMNYRYRTPFVNCVSLGWSTFLSGMANNKANDDQKGEVLVS
ncbi:hypothetical protein BBJ29_005275 [Phytophthora kernoviae]|uniref:Uncharacterized protein n=1 Tax=Phytophthora kernoviae TaxID=325452 RepID=A0A3F2RZD5_9STRA|nr:hypothetical protein BBJ29_005275 [Phytophthora kernoviae]RLN67248.1 hypothetical protein BBP00_00001748 [Phytophthora kernoviae]